MSRLYLDNNSTTPMLPEVTEAMVRVQRECVGNAASAHRSGAGVRRVLEEARATVARCLGAHVDEVVFTSGATEANNLALFGLAGSASRGEVLVAGIEHPSVMEPCRVMAQQGFKLVELPVDGQGYVRTLPVEEVQAGEKRIVTLQLANHETGVVQDVAAVRRQVPGALFHTDATQAVGKMTVNFHELGVSTLACSAHKYHGPAGVGVLLVNRCVRLAPRLFGGHQQGGVRPGTEPVALAVGLATALQLACDEMETRRAKCVALREVFLREVRSQVEHVVINGDAERGLPHTLNLSFPGCSSETLFIRLDLAGVDCSTGSACSSGSMLPSPVMKAMGVTDEVLRSAMRFSLSHVLTEAEVLEAGGRVGREVGATLRSGVPSRRG